MNYLEGGVGAAAAREALLDQIEAKLGYFHAEGASFLNQSSREKGQSTSSIWYLEGGVGAATAREALLGVDGKVVVCHAQQRRCAHLRQGVGFNF